jgi:ABC-type phosphate transport system permease subunit
MINIKKGANMKILQGLTGTIHSLTSIVIALLGLAIVISLLGGNVPFVGGVADNIVGLVAAIIILNFYK